MEIDSDLTTEEISAIAEEAYIYAFPMMMGFWNDPEATESRMRDGCVLTGDIGRLGASQGTEWRPTAAQPTDPRWPAGLSA
jgi:acyl-coenzyme A synthetase/AMP-(fatty) acid ligase